MRQNQALAIPIVLAVAALCACDLDGPLEARRELGPKLAASLAEKTVGALERVPGAFSVLRSPSSFPIPPIGEESCLACTVSGQVCATYVGSNCDPDDPSCTPGGGFGPDRRIDACDPGGSLGPLTGTGRWDPPAIALVEGRIMGTATRTVVGPGNGPFPMACDSFQADPLRITMDDVVIVMTGTWDCHAAMLYGLVERVEASPIDFELNLGPGLDGIDTVLFRSPAGGSALCVFDGTSVASCSALE